MTTATTPHPPGGFTSRHLAGLQQATAVPTQSFQVAQLLLGEAARVNGIAAVSGPPGCGKTFAVDHFIRTHMRMAGRTWHWLDMPPKPTNKEVAQRLMTGLGLPFSRRDTLYELTEDLAPALEASAPVVVIDEAQNLKTDGLQQLRYLHDRSNGHTWTLLLVGSTVKESLAGAQELASRVSGWVQFSPLTSQPLLETLRSWHPLLAAMPPDLLLRVDEVYARGNFRLWAQFLRALLSFLDRQPAGTLPDDRLVQAALAAVSPSQLRAR